MVHYFIAMPGVVPRARTRAVPYTRVKLENGAVMTIAVLALTVANLVTAPWTASTRVPTLHLHVGINGANQRANQMKSVERIQMVNTNVQCDSSTEIIQVWSRLVKFEQLCILYLLRYKQTHFPLVDF